MLIALDYDKTYTEDRTLWNDFIKAAQKRGHVVKIVTMRSVNEPVTDAPISIIYTNRKAKASVVSADIWIDDSPAWIYQNSL